MEKKRLAKNQKKKKNLEVGHLWELGDLLGMTVASYLTWKRQKTTEKDGAPNSVGWTFCSKTLKAAGSWFLPLLASKVGNNMVKALSLPPELFCYSRRTSAGPKACKPDHTTAAYPRRQFILMALRLWVGQLIGIGLILKEKNLFSKVKANLWFYWILRNDLICQCHVLKPTLLTRTSQNNNI